MMRARQQSGFSFQRLVTEVRDLFLKGLERGEERLSSSGVMSYLIECDWQQGRIA